MLINHGNSSNKCKVCHQPKAWTPPTRASWKQTLKADHTDPQPLPGQTLKIKWKEKDNEIKIARTNVFVPFHKRTLGAGVVLDIIRTQDKILGVVLRNCDGRHGLDLADSLENMMGIDVLDGRGSKNNCSNALGGTCNVFCDNFTKLWPLMESGHGGNFDGQVSEQGLPRIFLDNFVRVVVDEARAVSSANSSQAHIHKAVPQLSPSNLGLLQIQRYVCKGCRGKRKASRLHMHVDKNERSHGLVCVLSLGNSCVFSLDDGSEGKCAHNLKYEKSMTSNHESGKRMGEDLKRWDELHCETCQNIELHSGDVLLFDGREEAKIAHGIRAVLEDTGPQDAPEWLSNCRLGVQFRSIK